MPEAARVALSAQQIHCEEYAFVETEINVAEQDAIFIKDLAKQKVVVVFTSAQTVAAVINCLGDENPDWSICCISGATKTALLAFFDEGKIIASANDSIDLLHAMNEIVPQKVVFFCGQKRLDTIPVRLTDRGFELIECKVYETILKSKKTNSHYDGLLFFSPSGVESFFVENEISEGTVLFSIGKTTAKALQEKVDNKVIISEQPDKNILVQTVIDFYKQEK